MHQRCGEKALAPISTCIVLQGHVQPPAMLKILARTLASTWRGTVM